ncbi:MAG: shikimate dehydrogenase [Bacteroidaceae bacterium]|nr:shikimate dehydrogenase [Bacteroidaceae bacterium]
MDQYGLIGFPLGHSFSRSYFNERFRKERINAEYLNFEIPTIENFPDILKSNPSLKGLNVTIPYKEKIIPYLDELSIEASSIKAVNVIKIIKNNDKTELIGHNTDVIGFTQSLKPLLKPHHTKALVLGTGGASKAVCHGLNLLGIDYQYVSRHESETAISYEQLTPQIMAEHEVIVNCTPIGMYPHTEECPNIPYEQLTPNHLLFDLIYNPDVTLFMQKGIQQGAIAKNGLEMLKLQAIAAWEIWQK